MPRYVIERGIPGAGGMSDSEWQGAAAQSNKTLAELEELRKQIKWIHSYVTPDKVYCVYEAADEEVIREHGRVAGFPTDYIAEINRMIDPTTENG